jgi:hypothetical protein
MIWEGAHMDNGIKDNIKKIAKETEVKVAGLLLRWKEHKEGNDTPDMEAIDRKSREIAEKANEIIQRRGKTVLKEFKDAYGKGTTDKEDNKD